MGKLKNLGLKYGHPLKEEPQDTPVQQNSIESRNEQQDMIDTHNLTVEEQHDIHSNEIGNEVQAQKN